MPQVITTPVQIGVEPTWATVTIQSLSPNRIELQAPYSVGDVIEYDTASGTRTINPDGTFSTTAPSTSAQSTPVRVFNSSNGSVSSEEQFTPQLTYLAFAVTPQPETGWARVTITSLASSRVVLSSPYGVGDDIEYDTLGGTRTINPDGTIQTTAALPQAGEARVYSAGNVSAEEVYTQQILTPTLINPSVSQVTAIGVQLRVITDTIGGTVSWAVRQGGSQLDPDDIKAGIGAILFGSASAAASGQQYFDVLAGLQQNTVYSADFVHQASTGQDSNVVTATFQTLALAPVLLADIPTQTLVLGVAMTPLDLGQSFAYGSSYGIAQGTLPSGLALAGGVVSGTPTSVTPATLIFTATNAVGTTQSNQVAFAVGDTVPDAYSIPAVTDAEPGELITSPAVIPVGYSNQTAISVVGGEISVSGQPFVTSGLILPGQSFRVRLQAASQPGTQAQATVTVGTITAVFSVTTRAADSIPDALQFGYVGKAGLSSQQESLIIPITGVDAGITLPISISNGEYRINGGAYTTTPGTVSVGDTVQIRVTTSANHSTTVQALLNVQGVISAFTATTLADPNAAPTEGEEPVIYPFLESAIQGSVFNSSDTIRSGVIE